MKIQENVPERKVSIIDVEAVGALVNSAITPLGSLLCTLLVSPGPNLAFHPESFSTLVVVVYPIAILACGHG